MKRTVFCLAAFAAILTLSNCHSSKKAMASAPAVSYDNGVQAIISANCAPCHIPSKGGNKLPLDTYTAVKGNVDEILSRIKLNPGERGFMPKNHAKLSDSTIAVIEQWKMGGAIEK